MRPRKRFGQHFLIHEEVLDQIVSVLGINAEDFFIEIGPGKGALTKYLIPRVKHLDVIEIDRDLTAYLQQQFQQTQNLNIYNADVLHFDWQSLLSFPHRVVGNIPYNITTPLLFKLLSLTDKIIDMHFLLQKEVVERLTALPGDGHYGRLTVMAQYHAKLSQLFNVDRQSFSPPPKVESSVLRIETFKIPPFQAANFKLFADVVREAFNYRRKTIANSLRKFITVPELEQLNIDPHCRPQQITVENFVKISNILK